MSDVSELITVLNDHGFTDVGTAAKVRVINEVVWDVNSREPWRYLEKDLTLTWDGTAAIPTNWPTDLRAVISIVDTQWPRRLYPLRIEEFRDRFGSDLTDKNDPIYYYFLAKQANFWPIPASTNTTVVMNYLRLQAELVEGSVESAILIPKEHHDVIWKGALVHMYFQDDDPELAQEAERRFEEKIIKMRNELWMVQYDRADTIEVTDPDDIFYNI